MSINLVFKINAKILINHEIKNVFRILKSKWMQKNKVWKNLNHLIETLYVFVISTFSAHFKEM